MNKKLIAASLVCAAAFAARADVYISEFMASNEGTLTTANGRNDLDIIGPTPREVSNYIISLRSQIWKEHGWN